VNFAKKVCDIIMKWPFSGPQLTICWYLFTEIRYFITVCSVSCVNCPRELYYLILVVWVSINRNNKTWRILMLHVMWCLVFWAFSSTILNCAGNIKDFTHYLLKF
jgi:hypothetical protein